MTGRAIALVLALLVAALVADALPAGKVYRVGFLGVASAAGHAEQVEAMRDGLRALGYVEGQNLAIQTRYAGGRFEYLPALAEELTRLKVDVIVSLGSAATSAAKALSAPLPVAFVTEDPVEENLVSLSRPGGNLTGMALMNPERSVEWIHLVRDALPAIRRVAILWDPTGTRAQLQSAEAAARSQGFTTLTILGHLAYEIDAAFETARKQRVLAALAGVFDETTQRAAIKVLRAALTTPEPLSRPWSWPQGLNGEL